MRHDETIRIPLPEDHYHTRHFRPQPDPRQQRPRSTPRPAAKPVRERRPLTEPTQQEAQRCQQAPPPKRPKRRRKKRGCGCFSFILFWVILLISCAVGYWFFAKSQVPPPIETLPVNQQRDEALSRSEHNVTILLAGDDERQSDEAARSDTIMMMVMRPVDKKIGLVAFPRDSLVDIPGQGEDKINAALAYGGVPLLKSTLQQLTHNPVDHHVLVNFQTFQKVVDAMGGVQINVPEKMYLPEENIDLKPGDQLLNGYEALAFVRWRGDGKGDIGRMERQRQFMEAVSAKARHLMPWQAARLAYVLHKEVNTDLSPLESLRLAANMAGIDKKFLSFKHFELNPQYINGISYVLLDKDNIRSVMNELNYGVDIDELP